MVREKLEKLVKRIESNTTIDKGMTGVELGWVKIYIKHMEEDIGEITKKDLLKANKLWEKYKND